jgi:predicted DsbA family dithiol-disulfide isomerase
VNSSASSALPAVGERDHVTGSSSPKLTLVEYGDFGCPYCFQASRPVKSLLDRFDGLRLVWRHFPVPALHPRADLAAELSELAGLHGQFWDAHSLLLTPRGRFSHDDLLSVAGRLELDPAETHAALREHTFRERVLADIEAAGELESTRRRPSSSMASAWTGPGANSRRSCGQASQQPNRPALTSRGRAR